MNCCRWCCLILLGLGVFVWPGQANAQIETPPSEEVVILEINTEPPPKHHPINFLHPFKHERSHQQATIPAIPEPMVFDLVRPLGAKKGELEVNSLFLVPVPIKGREGVDWAPEVEYAFRDNQAVELELPFANLQLQDIKTTYQVTFGTGFRHHFIHGAQFIGRYNLAKKSPSADGLYIWGYKFDKNFSVMSMQGVRHTSFKHGGHLVGLLNPTLFYTPSQKFRLGLETNLELGKPKNNYYLFMLQAHIQLRKHHNLQVGAGFQKFASDQFSPVMGIRFVKEI